MYGSKKPGSLSIMDDETLSKSLHWHIRGRDRSGQRDPEKTGVGETQIMVVEG